MVKAASRSHKNLRYILIVGLFAIALYVLIPQLGEFKASRNLLESAKWRWVYLALLFTWLTYFSAAATYWLLAYKPLRYGRTVLLQLAAVFLNKLLPAGVGGLSINYLYLKRNGHNAGQAGTIAGVNNLLGVVGHGLVTVAALFTYTGAMSRIVPGNNTSVESAVRTGAVIVGAALLVGFLMGRRRFMRTIKDSAKQLGGYRQHPWRLPLALASSISLTLANIISLYFCAVALGVHLPFVAILFIFSLAQGAGTVTPTPGGLGGYEVAMIAVLVSYGVDGATALAIALLYRLISYWFPVAAGAVAFVVCQRRGYI